MVDFPDCCEKMKRLKVLSNRAENENDITALLVAQDAMEKHRH